MYILTQIQSICLFCTQWMMPCMIILWSVKPSQLCQPSGFPKAYHHDLIKLYSSFFSHFFWQQQLFASNYYLVLVRMRNKNKKLSIIIHKNYFWKEHLKKQFWNLKKYQFQKPSPVKHHQNIHTVHSEKFFLILTFFLYITNWWLDWKTPAEKKNYLKK